MNAMNKDTQITTKGLEAIANADFGGFKLTIDKFRITSYTYAVNENLLETLKGVSIFNGSVSSVEVLNDSSVQYECVVPRSVPTTGSSVEIGEIGIYLDTGELFAVGKIVPALIKDRETAFSLTIIIAAAKLCGVINVNVTDKTSLSRTTTNRLINPKDAVSNTVIVSDASTIDNETTATIALKLGNNINEWSFVGFHKVASTKVEQVSPNGFLLEPNSNGFG